MFYPEAEPLILAETPSANQPSSGTISIIMINYELNTLLIVNFTTACALLAAANESNE